MQTPSSAARRLNELWLEIRQLQAAMDLLEWDARTYLPAGGQSSRGRALATLTGRIHRRLVAPELHDVIARCAEEAEPDSRLAAQVTCARLEADPARKVPETLARAIAEASSSGLAAWERARSEGSFSPFCEPLERLVRLKKEQAAAISSELPAYDVLLQQFEPEATASQLEPLFHHLRVELGELVRQRSTHGSGSNAENPFRGRFSAAGQRRLAEGIATALGFDFSRGRLDPSTHPFCVGLHPSDVRLTWRWREDDLRPALSGLLHETGHGLYEQGMPATSWGTPIGRDASCGLHESQARLWENHVGQHPGFWRWLGPKIAAMFPEQGEHAPELYLRTLREVHPSPIRIEADPTTYDLHIAARFELEKQLFDDRLRVADLPQAWDDLYLDYLGLRPEGPVQGVLQDIHWAEGLFGYFPTYTLGNLAAAQLFAAAESTLGDLTSSFARGNFEPLREWLREHVHQHVSRYPTPELIRRATGRELSPGPLLRHRKDLTRPIPATVP